MSIARQRRVQLINVKLPSYGGKALRAGEPFQASIKDAKALVAVRMATYATRDIARAKPIAAKATRPLAPEQTELARLRAAYEELARKKAPNFWKADQLRAQIAKLEVESAADAEPETSITDEDPSDE